MIGNANRSGGRPAIKSDWEYRERFSVPDHYFDPVVEGEEVVDGGTRYYQELHHWPESVEEVWEIFQPSDEAAESTVIHAPEVATSSRSCSVHYRLGDYLKNPNHFPIPTTNYYHTAIQKVLDKEPDTDFFVFSDDIDTIQQMWEEDDGLYRALINNDRVRFIRGTITPVEVADRVTRSMDWLDLFAQRYCDDHVIANSTFSWWGAWLSDSRHAYYPSVWWGPAIKEIPWREGIPKDWTEVEC